MEVALHLNSPVLLVGDTDKGGVFASLYGTVSLVSDEERELIKGIIINKFKGNISLLNPEVSPFVIAVNQTCRPAIHGDTIIPSSHALRRLNLPTFGDLFSSVDLSMLLLVASTSYVLGALPLADQVSRRRGVNIFLTGTGLAGSSNVLKTVGKVPAAVVFLGDMAKGVVAIFVAQALGVEGSWLVIPATAAVVGHWHSVFTRLKGGDALATFAGSTLVVFAGYGLAGVAFACVVTLGARKLPFTLPFVSLFSIIFGYTMIVFLSVLNYAELKVVVAFSALAVIVFAHALLGHALRRRGYEPTDEIASETAN